MIDLIKPLFKGKGSPDATDNYRGITLLSCVGKLFTAIINERITLFIDSYDLLGEVQAGFRSGYSTMDHILSLHAIVDCHLQKRKKCIVLLWMRHL